MPKALLQIAELAADGGLADIQGNLCRSEAAALDDRHEDREHVEIGLVKTWNGGCARRTLT